MYVFIAITWDITTAHLLEFIRICTILLAVFHTNIIKTCKLTLHVKMHGSGEIFHQHDNIHSVCDRQRHIGVLQRYLLEKRNMQALLKMGKTSSLPRLPIHPALTP